MITAGVPQDRFVGESTALDRWLKTVNALASKISPQRYRIVF